MSDDEQSVIPRGAGKWGRPEVPKTGWTCVDIEDLGEIAAVCEMCEYKEIRYVQHMTHPDYTTRLACGRVRAGQMEVDDAAALCREQQAKSIAARRKRYFANRTMEVRTGGVSIKFESLDAGWRAHVNGPAPVYNGERFTFTTEVYPNERQCREDVFDAVLRMRGELDLVRRPS